jgi:hypothetical protein
MMIGGFDTIYKTETPEELAKSIVEFLGWSSGVYEYDEGLDFFYYMDEASKKSWDEGVEDDNAPMVYFIFGLPIVGGELPSTLSVVSDQETAFKIREKFPDYTPLSFT